MSGRSQFPWVLTLVFLAFNFLMLAVFLNLQADLRAAEERAQYCGEGWVGDDCREGPATVSFGIDLLRIAWVTFGVILGGSWVARCASMAHSRRRRPAAARRTCHVHEPGTSLEDSLNHVAVWLPAGTEVVEVERQGRSIKVTLPDGRSGWLKRGSVS